MNQAGKPPHDSSGNPGSPGNPAPDSGDVPLVFTEGHAYGQTRADDFEAGAGPSPMAGAPHRFTRPASHGVPVGRGAGWIADGFALFKRDPAIWAATMLIFFVIMTLLALIPIAGQIVLCLLLPVFTAGLLLGCRAQSRGEALTVAHLLAGFGPYAMRLVLVGAYELVGVLLVVALVMLGGVSSIVQAFGGGGAASRVASLQIFGLGVAGLALLASFLMAGWYAPALVVFRGYGAGRAMRMSLAACLKNIAPLMLFCLLTLPLLLLAGLPALLGLLVLGPVMFGAQYSSYAEVFYEPFAEGAK